jgi:Putative transposase
VLSRVFRGKFVAGLRAAFRAGALQFHGHPLPLAEPHAFASWLRPLLRHDWVVYSKRPFGGPEHVLRYLGAYTHRVAIANSRLVALSEGNLAFRRRDSAHGNKKRLMTLPVEEFLRRFLLHLLPRGFMHIRNFGFLVNRRRAELLPLCSRLLQQSHPPAARIASPALPIHSLWHVRFAAEPCKLSNASPRRNFSSDLRLISAGAPHESTSPASNLARASARTLLVSRILSACSMVVRFRLSDAPPHAHSLCDPLLKPKRSDRNGKLENDQDRLTQIQIPQSPGAASFKSLYLKRPFTAASER